MSPRCSISGIGTDSETDNVQRSSNKINQYVGKVEWGKSGSKYQNNTDFLCSLGRKRATMKLQTTSKCCGLL